MISMNTTKFLESEKIFIRAKICIFFFFFQIYLRLKYRFLIIASFSGNQKRSNIYEEKKSVLWSPKNKVEERLVHSDVLLVILSYFFCRASNPQFSKTATKLSLLLNRLYISFSSLSHTKRPQTFILCVSNYWLPNFRYFRYTIYNNR